MRQGNTTDLPIAIVGGGFSGTLLMVNLLRLGARVTLLERDGARLAKGLAFGTRQPEHLLNVRAANMSAYPDDPAHFVRWMGFDTSDQANQFVARRAYGQYLRQQLEEAVAAASGRAELIAEEVVEISHQDSVATLLLANGQAIQARAVALAVGNFSPPPFAPFSGLVDRFYFPDPWLAGTIAHAHALKHVLLIGTGLTAVDMILSLDDAGYRGRFTALSRRGLAPRSHAEQGPTVNPVDCPEVRGSYLVRRVRQRARDIGWRGAVDELRPHTQNLWRRHGEIAQRRFLRHLRPWWDVHRHRLAPEVAARVTALVSHGRLSFVAGKVVRAIADGDQVAVTLRRRGAEQDEMISVERVINCTGPAGDIALANQPLIRALLASGHIRPDVHRLGLDVDHTGRVRDATGVLQNWLFAVGPITKGEAWEIVAVPDIRRQVWNVARSLTANHWVGGEGL